MINIYNIQYHVLVNFILLKNVIIKNLPFQQHRIMNLQQIINKKKVEFEYRLKIIKINLQVELKKIQKYDYLSIILYYSKQRLIQYYYYFIYSILSSNTNLQMTIQQQKQFRSKQYILNNQISQNYRNNFKSPIKFIQNQQQNSLDKNSHSLEKKIRFKNDQYNNLLKEQITLSRIEDENTLSKSRKIDGSHGYYNKENYPFGFQGVKVCEEVIEKYKASNYKIQKNVLQKFEKEAQEYRKNRIKRYIKQTIPVTIPVRYSEPVQVINNFSTISNVRQQKKPQKNISFENVKQKIVNKKKEINRQKQNKQMLKRKKRKNELDLSLQKQNLTKVGNMLKQIDDKLKQNSQKLSADLKQLRNHFHHSVNKPKVVRNKQEKLFKIVKNFEQNTNSYQRIPVIIYNPNMESSYCFNNSSQYAPKINRKDIFNSSANINNTLIILRKNENRLKLLTEQSMISDGSDY